MQINKSEQKKHRVSNFISGARLVSGFTLAPTLGALVFYFMMNVPLLFGYKLPGMLLSVSPEFLIGGTLIAGSIFYAPTVMIGFVIMMLIRRYYSWNLTNCIIGGVLCAFAVSSIFLTALMFIGQGLMVAGAGFSMIMTLIIIPSVLSGTSFWLIAVHKNHRIESYCTTNRARDLQFANAGACTEAGSSLNPSTDYHQCSNDESVRIEETL